MVLIALFRVEESDIQLTFGATEHNSGSFKKPTPKRKKVVSKSPIYVEDSDDGAPARTPPPSQALTPPVTPKPRYVCPLIALLLGLTFFFFRQ